MQILPIRSFLAISIQWFNELKNPVKSYAKSCRSVNKPFYHSYIMLSGVSKIMVTGTSLTASKDALRLSRLYPGVLYATAGIHPHDAKSWDEESMPTLRELLQNRECVAVGECGLDFNRNFSPPETQLEVFEKQVCGNYLLSSTGVYF